MSDLALLVETQAIFTCELPLSACWLPGVVLHNAECVGGEGISRPSDGICGALCAGGGDLGREDRLTSVSEPSEFCAVVFEN